MSLKVTYTPSLRAVIKPTAGLKQQSILVQMDPGFVITLQDGSGANEAKQVFGASETLAASGVMTLDLALFGGALDPDGAAYNLTAVKAIGFRNISTDATAQLQIGGGSPTNPWLSFNGSASVPLLSVLDPGAEWVFITPSAAGLAVSSTNKALKITNLSGTAAAEFEVIVIGIP
jgi:hypothetical protein